MKGRYLVLGALFALAAVFAVTIWPDAALAAPLSAAPAIPGQSWMQTALLATPALIALRAELREVTDKATRKLEEVSDGLGADAIRTIEQDHATLVAKADEIRTRIVAEEARANPGQPDHGSVLRAERERSAGILDMARRAALTGTEAETAIAGNVSLDAFRAQVSEILISRQTPTSHVRIERDETETRRLGMEEAVIRSMNPRNAPAAPTEAARAYEGLSLVAMAAERLGERRYPETMAAREDVLRRAMHTTSDFPIILENAVNRSIAASYALAVPTYREWSVREDFNDFRPHITVQTGDFPLTKPVLEGGKFAFGTVGEKKEQVAVAAYAIQVALSRQLLVNDTLGALERVIANYGQSLALTEETIAYSVLQLNSGDGPTLLEGAAAMFTTGRTNKAAANAAITETSVSVMRAAVLKYKSVDGNLLAPVMPTKLLVSPDKLTEAEKFVSAVIPAATANVNIFAGKFSVVTSSQLSGNRWWAFVDPSVRANFRYGLLSGYSAPRIRTETPFGQNGMGVSVEHDFGFGGIDWRAGFTNAGA